jgi:hypothetical protein
MISSIEYLGLIISEDEIHMDPVKVEGVSQEPTPECKHNHQSFLVFVNFYCCFICGFGGIAKPLNGLTGNTP